MANNALLISQSHLHIVLYHFIARIAALLQIAIGHRTIGI